MTAGRPPKFKSVKDLQDKIDAYFKTTGNKLDKKGNVISHKPATITGLALALDTTRETLLDYQDKEEYSDTIKKAKLRVENYAEEMLYIGKAAIGSIFTLKNNFNWKDTRQTELSGPNGKPIQTNQTLDDSDRDIINRYLAQKPTKKE